MTTPVTAMTAFLPTVDRQTRRRVDREAVGDEAAVDEEVVDDVAAVEDEAAVDGGSALVGSAMVLDGRTGPFDRSKTWFGSSP
ncbi:hypothetical protein ABT112_23090 [Streptomyces sp. NPDC002055]|uniref:hypothetical protein n=1 Tax=Streptomyces sp. NPDC002055 TaxID=3154534 RepID=UPI0033165083